MFILSEKETELTIYNQIPNPLISFAVGNSDIGLLFGQRVKPNMVWELRYDGKGDLILVDENDISSVIGNIPGVKSLSFVFDSFAFPIIAVETLIGVEVYKFKNYANESNSFELISSFEGYRNPKLIPSNNSDLGSIQNQPYLFTVDDVGIINQRTLKDNFNAVIDRLDRVMQTTDILEKIAITQNGKIQISISKLKIES